MRIHPVACLRDNYAYLIEGDEPGVAVVVDPSEAPPVEAALASLGLRLGAIWATHHHRDHVGGIDALVAARPGLTVAAGAFDAPKIEGVTVALADGDEIASASVRARALHIPGHTRGAMAFVVVADGTPAAVFTGDTLFCAGCGRLFEGTPAEMHRSLTIALGALPDETAVYCGHEYTQANLRFAAHVEPANTAIADRARDVANARAAGLPTVPSTMGIERATNPFLRAHTPAARAFAALDDGASEVDVFAKLRAAKDAFLPASARRAVR